MKIAVLSGKGGTGKTTVSLGLFSILDDVTLIDTDVEEPNDHLFLPYVTKKEISVTKEYPFVYDDLCTLCGKCGEFCNFNAILPTKKSVLVYEDLCHDCGGCSLVCPTNAIAYKEKEIGIIYETLVDQKKFHYGNLNIGEVSGVKLIKQLKEGVSNDDTVIIDSPPGTSCATVEAVSDVDYCIIVTEPTPFGLSDMKMVVEMLRNMNLTFGVVVNKAGLGTNETYTYLKEESIPLLGEIPFKKEFATLYSEGKSIAQHSKEFSDIINDILQKVGEYCA